MEEFEVQVWGCGWATVADKFDSWDAANAFMQSLIELRRDGATALRLVTRGDVDY